MAGVVIAVAALVLALAIPMLVTHTLFVRKIRNKPSVLLFDGESPRECRRDLTATRRQVSASCATQR
jgi:hypothetical protein